MAGTTGYDFLASVNGLFVDRGTSRQMTALYSARGGRRRPDGRPHLRGQAAHHAGLDGERDQPARPPARPHLRAQPLSPATSPCRAWPRAPRGDRRLPGLPHLRGRRRHRRRRPARPRLHRGRGRGGQAPQPDRERLDLRLRPRRAAAASSGPAAAPRSAPRGATSRCASSSSPARSWPRASRTPRSTATTAWSRSTRWAAIRRASASRSRVFHAAQRAAARALARVDARHVHPRHQARRGRARAHQRALRGAGRVGRGGAPLARDRPAMAAPDRRARRARPQRRVPALPDPGRRLARARRGRAARDGHRAASSPTWRRPPRRPRSTRAGSTRASPTTGRCASFVARAPRSRRPASCPRSGRSSGWSPPTAAVNSLAQTLLKLAVPGVPDFYQGTELWDLSLVDPDNRRPVDFARRRALLEALTARVAADAADRGGRHRPVPRAARRLAGRPREALPHPRARSPLRRERARLFAAGAYRALGARRPARRPRGGVRRGPTARDAVIVVVPRLTARLGGLTGSVLLGEAAWEHTAIALGEDLAGVYRDALHRLAIASERRDGAAVLPAATLFAHLPVALLERWPPPPDERPPGSDARTGCRSAPAARRRQHPVPRLGAPAPRGSSSGSSEPGRAVAMPRDAGGWAEHVTRRRRGHPLPLPDRRRRCPSRIRPRAGSRPACTARREVVDPPPRLARTPDWRGRAARRARASTSSTSARSRPRARSRPSIAQLDHLVALGVTAVELMPVADFPGARGWGYDGVRSSRRARLRRARRIRTLVDACHAARPRGDPRRRLQPLRARGQLPAPLRARLLHPSPPHPVGRRLNYDGPGSRRRARLRDRQRAVLARGLPRRRAAARRGPRASATTPRATSWPSWSRGAPRRPAATRAPGARERRQRGRAISRRRGRGRPLYVAQWNDDLHHALHVLLTGDRRRLLRGLPAAPSPQLGRGLTEGFAYQGEALAYRGGRHAATRAPTCRRPRS